jgi:hypothetical protein
MYPSVIFLVGISTGWGLTKLSTLNWEASVRIVMP